jgi:hypothetical protein
VCVCVCVCALRGAGPGRPAELAEGGGLTALRLDVPIRCVMYVQPISPLGCEQWPRWLIHCMLRVGPTVKIFFSPRFARVVDLIWLGPIFRWVGRCTVVFCRVHLERARGAEALMSWSCFGGSFYAKLYLYFLGSTAFMLLTFTPLPLRICETVQSS